MTGLVLVNHRQIKQFIGFPNLAVFEKLLVINSQSWRHNRIDSVEMRWFYDLIGGSSASWEEINERMSSIVFQEIPFISGDLEV